MPVSGLLIRITHSKHASLVEWAADYLDTNRETLRRKAAGNGKGWEAR